MTSDNSDNSDEYRFVIETDETSSDEQDTGSEGADFKTMAEDAEGRNLDPTELTKAASFAAELAQYSAEHTTKAATVLKRVRETITQPFAAAANASAHTGILGGRGTQYLDLMKHLGIFRGVSQWTPRQGIPDQVHTWGHELIDEYELDTHYPEDPPEDDFNAAAAELEEKATEYLQSPEARFERVMCLLLNFLRHDEPAGIYYDYVDLVVDEEVSSEYRDRLTRRLEEAIEDLFDRICDRLQTLFPDDLDEATKSAWTIQVFRWEPWPDNGMLWLDKVGLEWVDEWCGLGNFDGYQRRARQRWQGDRETPEFLTLWVDPKARIPWKLQPIEVVTEHLWKNENNLEDAWGRRKNTPDSALSEQVDGDIYGRFGHPYAGAAPAFSKTVTAGEDDDEYRCAPADLTPYHVHDVVSTRTRSAPHQQILPPIEGADTSAVTNPGNRQILTVPEAKLMVRFALATRRPRPNLSAERQYDGESTVGELAEEIFAHYDRLRPEQFESVAQAARRISKDIRLRIHYEAGTNRVPAFLVEHPDDLNNVDPSQPIRWRAAPQLFNKLNEHDIPLRDGTIVFNRTKFMRLDGRRGLDLRTYMIAAAAWNRARNHDNGRIETWKLTYTDEEWAAETTAYSDAGWRYYLNSETTSRDDRSGYERYREGRKRARRSLERLENQGLIVIEGDLDDEFAVLPPDALDEAWHKFRAAVSDRIK